MLSISEACRLAFDATSAPDKWGSLVIDRRKPHTFRAFIQVGDSRICLHRFEPCEPSDSFAHPHPWPSSMLVLSGEYEMAVSYTSDLSNSDHSPVIRVFLGAGSTYQMLERETWHQVIPRTRCYSLMVNGPRWDNPHRRAPSTGGKGLRSMSEDELGSHLDVFQELLSPYLSTDVD